MSSNSSSPSRRSPTATSVTHEELQSALGRDACALVDVREPHEYEAGHIPGATNLPMSRFDPAELPTASRSCWSVSRRAIGESF